MLRKMNQIPLDYSICCMTVTVYRREGLTRRVIKNAHYEFTDSRTVQGAVEDAQRQFLLVVPGDCPLRPGDKVVLGEHPGITCWEELDVPSVQTLGIIDSVKPRYFRGARCHTEARGG